MSQEHPLVTDFLNYLRFERHFSPHTGKCYAADLQQFSQFLVGGPEAAANVTFTPRGQGGGAAVGGRPGTAVATATSTQVSVNAEDLRTRLLKVDTNQI